MSDEKSKKLLDKFHELLKQVDNLYLIAELEIALLFCKTNLQRKAVDQRFLLQQQEQEQNNNFVKSIQSSNQKNDCEAASASIINKNDESQQKKKQEKNSNPYLYKQEEKKKQNILELDEEEETASIQISQQQNISSNHNEKTEISKNTMSTTETKSITKIANQVNQQQENQQQDTQKNIVDPQIKDAQKSSKKEIQFNTQQNSINSKQPINAQKPQNTLISKPFQIHEIHSMQGGQNTNTEPYQRQQNTFIQQISGLNNTQSTIIDSKLISNEVMKMYYNQLSNVQQKAVPITQQTYLNQQQAQQKLNTPQSMQQQQQQQQNYFQAQVSAVQKIYQSTSLQDVKIGDTVQNNIVNQSVPCQDNKILPPSNTQNNVQQDIQKAFNIKQQQEIQNVQNRQQPLYLLQKNLQKQNEIDDQEIKKLGQHIMNNDSNLNQKIQLEANPQININESSVGNPQNTLQNKNQPNQQTTVNEKFQLNQPEKNVTEKMQVQQNIQKQINMMPQDERQLLAPQIVNQQALPNEQITLSQSQQIPFNQRNQPQGPNNFAFQKPQVQTQQIQQLNQINQNQQRNQQQYYVQPQQQQQQHLIQPQPQQFNLKYQQQQIVHDQPQQLYQQQQNSNYYQQHQSQQFQQRQQQFQQFQQQSQQQLQLIQQQQLQQQKQQQLPQQLNQQQNAQQLQQLPQQQKEQNQQQQLPQHHQQQNIQLLQQQQQKYYQNQQNQQLQQQKQQADSLQNQIQQQKVEQFQQKQGEIYVQKNEFHNSVLKNSNNLQISEIKNEQSKQQNLNRILFNQDYIEKPNNNQQKNQILEDLSKSLLIGTQTIQNKENNLLAEELIKGTIKYIQNQIKTNIVSEDQENLSYKIYEEMKKSEEKIKENYSKSIDKDLSLIKKLSQISQNGEIIQQSKENSEEQEKQNINIQQNLSNQQKQQNGLNSSLEIQGNANYNEINQKRQRPQLLKNEQSEFEPNLSKKVNSEQKNIFDNKKTNFEKPEVKIEDFCSSDLENDYAIFLNYQIEKNQSDQTEQYIFTYVVVNKQKNFQNIINQCYSFSHEIKKNFFLSFYHAFLDAIKTIKKQNIPEDSILDIYLPNVSCQSYINNKFKNKTKIKQFMINSLVSETGQFRIEPKVFKKINK